jgi:sarcosine oxidase, subunit gamma
MNNPKPMTLSTTTALRTSPLHDILAKVTSQWATLNEMRVATGIGDAAEEQQRLRFIGLADLSHLKRSGLKGPGAEDWLKDFGIEPPAAINQWAPLGECSLIARLASSEFLIEDNVGQDYADRVRAKLHRGIPGVTPVLRQDAEIALVGPLLNELLLQTCSVNFAALDLTARPIVMTSMIGVSVLVIPGVWQSKPFYQLWCDATYAVYLWQHLCEIAEELGGGAVGLDALMPSTAPQH